MIYHNITELIGREEMRLVLRLCGTGEDECGETASDYEMFRAFCRVTPLLSGHLLLARARAILREGFGITETPSCCTCDAIWRETADLLLQAPRAADSFEGLLWEEGNPALLSENRVSLSSAFPATLLVRTRAGSFDSWMREIESVLCDAAARGCKSIFFGLPEPYTDRRPDVYHVDQALHKPRREKPDLDLLHAQLMRVVAQLSQGLGLRMILRVECGAEDAVAVLGRVEREVGLPSLIWTTAREDVRDALVKWSAEEHGGEIFAALTESDFPSEEARSAIVSAWATEYPVGRLLLLTKEGQRT